MVPPPPLLLPLLPSRSSFAPLARRFYKFSLHASQSTRATNEWRTKSSAKKRRGRTISITRAPRTSTALRTNSFRHNKLFGKTGGNCAGTTNKKVIWCRAFYTTTRIVYGNFRARILREIYSRINKENVYF